MAKGRLPCITWSLIIYLSFDTIQPPTRHMYADAFTSMPKNVCRIRSRTTTTTTSPEKRSEKKKKSGPSLLFQSNRKQSSVKREDEDERLLNDSRLLSCTSRRNVLQQSASLVASQYCLTSTAWIPPCFASPQTSKTSSSLSATDTHRLIDLNCLQDLPPLRNGSVRIYLCRHGQTENNRLRKVQGARVDPPINQNGKIQAVHLGDALARADYPPALWYSSPLTRAQQTAAIAIASQEEMRKENTIASSLSSSPSLSVHTLQSLREIDFGPFSDGQPIQRVQEQITKAYASWSLGSIDYRPPGGGESGREVFLRATVALNELVRSAREGNSAAIAAVSHSAFIRILIGVLKQEPILLSAVQKIYNGSITVIDCDTNAFTRLSAIRKSTLSTLFLPNDMEVDIPFHTVSCINEFRHLPPETLQ
ncbi:phosphoglyceromutase [Nitzschia inconspicua]|uniref:Phosphoglyceromutase n=1 Tax=Nitzschia inconspicua TaxID=303405 RepID=A0A9K3Q438_9STRA|nr:phosphoglyceromutase [Nitzschia inconspicua]